MEDKFTDLFTTKNIIAIVAIGTLLYFAKKKMMNSSSNTIAKRECENLLKMQKVVRTPEQMEKAINDCVKQKNA